MELPICECATEWPGQGHHPECPVRREIERLRTAIAAATERAEAAEASNRESIEMCRRARERCEGYSRAIDDVAKWVNRALDAEALAATLAARLAEVDDREHPA